jgi:hypothetical protein
VPYGVMMRVIEERDFPKMWKRVVFHLAPFTFFVLWIFSFIPLLGSLVYFLILVPLSARRHIELNNIEGKRRKNYIYLWYLTVIIIGFAGLWNFVGHFFMSDTVAELIGWETGSPFQIELAFYTLGSAVAGIFAIWLRGHMITALVISKSIFWYGAAYVHILDALQNANYAPYNVGTVLIGDIILPTLFIGHNISLGILRNSHLKTGVTKFFSKKVMVGQRIFNH